MKSKELAKLAPPIRSVPRHGVAVAFATDDSVPARDLDSGEFLLDSEDAGDRVDGGEDRAGNTPGIHLVGAEPSRPSRRRSASLEALADRFAPLVLAEQRRLALSEAMAPVAPEGLQRGTTVGVAGSGARSVALALAAGPMSTGSWLAVVGGTGLCLVGAEQLGVPLHHTVVIDEPPREAWGAVVAALLDGFELVVLDGQTPIGTRDARLLSGRIREHGGVLVDTAGLWPDAPDLMVEVMDRQWHGIGAGHGLLLQRTVEVAVSGRRGAIGKGAAAGRRVVLTLPPAIRSPLLLAALDASADESATPAAAAHAGADVDAIVDADRTGADGRAGDEQERRSPLRAVG